MKREKVIQYYKSLFKFCTSKHLFNEDKTGRTHFLSYYKFLLLKYTIDDEYDLCGEEYEMMGKMISSYCPEGFVEGNRIKIGCDIYGNKCYMFYNHSKRLFEPNSLDKLFKHYYKGKPAIKGIETSSEGLFVYLKDVDNNNIISERMDLPNLKLFLSTVEETVIVYSRNYKREEEESLIAYGERLYETYTRQINERVEFIKENGKLEEEGERTFFPMIFIYIKRLKG